MILYLLYYSFILIVGFSIIMKLIIDERETALYDTCYSILFSQGTAYSIQLEKKVLPLGDILIQTDEDKDVMLINAAQYQVRTIGRTGLTMFRCCVRLRNACDVSTK